ncbi:hypothetical protein CRG98_007557 [Punica granatum]|uniref:Secreted protein n=1 Tax=Punica granatum TaxID=22663 RepID=A0A2I0KU66_PUNGR|nr:hypothetical protein CRG98_007557 [Punica granatum]
MVAVCLVLGLVCIADDAVTDRFAACRLIEVLLDDRVGCCPEGPLLGLRLLPLVRGSHASARKRHPSRAEVPPRMLFCRRSTLLLGDCVMVCRKPMFCAECKWGHIFEGLDVRPLTVPVGHAWAYRDVLNDALTALSVVRRVHRLWTLLIRVP